MNKRSFILLFLMFNFYSCNYKKYKDTITNGKGTYWDVIKDGKRIFKTPSYSYFFGVTGECQYYSYRRSADGSIKRYLFDFGDMIYPKTWKLAEDTLQIQGFDYLLVSNKNKKLLLINLGRPTDSLELVESAIK